MYTQKSSKWPRHTTFSSLLSGALLILSVGTVTAGASDDLRDEDIVSAIDHQLFVDAAIDANRIHVDVQQGIAELTGTVRNVLAKERATDITELVRGVRSVSNRIEVKPSVLRTDELIRKDVERALKRDPAADAYQIDVQVRNNIVTLTGTVESWAEKALAATVTKGVRGVIDVRNDIRIDYETNRPDTEIQAEVEKRLQWDVLVDAYLIDVSVDDGVVHLSGTVGSAAEKRQAEMDARVTGVRAVDLGALNVKWWATDDTVRERRFVARSDDEIERAIKDAALYDPRVASFNIEPESNGGWVTLSGTLDNLKAKRAAEQLARNTVGVRGVTSHLKVRLEQPPSDEQIAAQVELALLVNPFIENHKIDVSVDDGWVRLKGTVDSNFQKLEAEDEASKVTGVAAVRNRIEVADRLAYVTPYYWYSWFDYPIPIDMAPTPSATSDQTIHERIRRELFWSPFVDADEVKVEVNHGVATLTGLVDSWREFRASAENAYEGGAISVVNLLEVKS